MKLSLAIALFVSSATAQMDSGKSMFTYFGACQTRKGNALYGNYGVCERNGRGADAQCCKFQQNDVDNTGLFCITDAMRDGETDGMYTDQDNTLWSWECKYDGKPSDEPTRPDNGGKNANDMDDDDGPGKPWGTYKDTDMELWLWITYLSGAFWVPGWIVMLPVGLGIYSWLWIYGTWTFFELLGGEGDFNSWFMGPFMRGWITGPFIYFSAVLLSIIPVIGSGTSFLFGWWANLDYYNYNYELFEGPTRGKGKGKGKDKDGDGNGKRPNKR